MGQTLAGMIVIGIVGAALTYIKRMPPAPLNAGEGAIAGTILLEGIWVIVQLILRLKGL